LVAEHFEATFTATLQDLSVARELLPLWTDWGVQDSGLTIHSLGVSCLALLGQRLGHVAVSELPAPNFGPYGYVGEDVRLDAVWFDRERRAPMLLAEFERYSGVEHQVKLEGKVQSLVLAQHRFGGTADLLVLAYWTPGLVSTPDHGSLRRIVSQGFTTPAKQRVYGCSGRLRLFQFVVQKGPDGLLRLAKIISRDVT